MDTFETRHAQVDPDPLKELKRRMAIWASAPDSRGYGLDAQIIPRATLQAAIAEIEEWRRVSEAIKDAKMRGSA